MTRRSTAWRIIVASVAFLCVYSLFFSFSALARASVSDWQQGVAIVPTSQTDLASEDLKASLRNLDATGANFVAFVVPYYQSNTHSIDIAPGWNTPTDAALVSAITFAHSLGLNVAIKVHVEPYSGEWRAYINPSDRAGWFRNYGNYVLSLARLAQSNGVEMMVLGTELVSMASSQMNSTNTDRWRNLIASVRNVYSGKLTYGANSSNNNDSQFENEKRYIGFWSSLDYAGLSPYVGLNTQNNSVDSLKGAWDYWNKNDLQQFAQSVGKPILFTEIGYRSVTNARHDPWNWDRGGGADEVEQANDYDALLGYWNDYPYVHGVFWWHWEVNPNAGGPGSTSYTPQNKAAQNVMKRWFTNAAPPSQPSPPSSPAVLSSSASVNPGNPAQGSSVSIAASVRNTGGALSNTIIDIEVYNEANTKVFQKFFESQSIGSNQTKEISTSWTAGVPGRYRVTVGVFNSNWTQNLHWNNEAARISVGSTAPPPNNPPPQNPPSGTFTTNIWWPSNNAGVSGIQPFKANIDGLDITQYRMFWSVDGGVRNEMFDSQTDYPHKESIVDVSGWRWRGEGPYTITFTSINSSGTTISQRSVNIWVQQ
ncbi:MAG TPA: hypothetical protein VD928_02495 [Candidatus Paceibacterota bacterium]|nr:hypothetical protein [Candidatus Paceibacterota bacterium]